MTSPKDTTASAAAQVTRLGVVYQPTQSEIRAAIHDALADDTINPGTPLIPVHIYAVLRDAFDRANRGEYK